MVNLLLQIYKKLPQNKSKVKLQAMSLEVLKLELKIGLSKVGIRPVSGIEGILMTY